MVSLAATTTTSPVEAARSLTRKRCVCVHACFEIAETRPGSMAELWRRLCALSNLVALRLLGVELYAHLAAWRALAIRGGKNHRTQYAMMYVSEILSTHQ
eukprot:COSAG05_NODE_2964_length_2459_cov_2.441525_3_plen_100_part_00